MESSSFVDLGLDGWYTRDGKDRGGARFMVVERGCMMGRKIKQTVFIIASLFLLGACSANEIDQLVESAPSAIEGEAEYRSEVAEFHSPEDVVIAYLEGLRDSDLNRMTEALSDNLPERIYPDEVIRDFIAHLNWLLEHFQSHLNPSEFQSLEILGFIPPKELDERYASEENQNILSSQAERIGAEQLVSRVVLFALGGEKYLLVVDVADFGGAWRLSQFGGNLGTLLFIAPQMHGMIPPEFVGEFLGDIDLESVMILP